MIQTTPEELKHLADLIRGIKVAMLTTLGLDGLLRCRPMATQETDFDGTLWFFTRADSQKVVDVEDEEQVNVSFADPIEQRFVSICGKATLTFEISKLEELWRPTLNAWFPLGLKDPQLALLKVETECWEYWDCQTTAMVKSRCLTEAPLALSAGEVDKLRNADMNDTWVVQGMDKDEVETGF